MSTTDAVADTDSDTDEHAHDHPSDLAYVKVAIFLGIITAIEVFTYFESVHGWGDNTLIVMLTLAMFIKFYTVAGWFMHLRFDNSLFTKMFTGGLVLAVGVYIAMLTAFRFF